jgi:hypothetical protein
MILSLLVAALIIVTAFAYVDLTSDLPSVQILPSLLNPPDGLLRDRRRTPIGLRGTTRRASEGWFVLSPDPR